MKNAFLAKKNIYDITKFTTLDFPKHLACILWFSKCNMRCHYCYNSQIVNSNGRYSNLELFAFLQKRVNKLDGVVLSGGECSLNPNIIELCEKIKDLGFHIKIDTNGLAPDVIKELIDYSLVDYIALDYKAPNEKFKAVTNTQISNENFYKTLDILIDKNFPFEARTTYHSDLLNENDINTIIDDLYERKYKGTYYIQNYLHVEDTLGSTTDTHKRLDKELLSHKIPIEIRN